MPNALRSQIETLAATFASSVVASIRGASLEDILSLANERTAPKASAATGEGKRGRGRPRKTTTETAAAATTSSPASTSGSPRQAILAFFRANPGASGGTARKALKMERGQWGYTVGALLETKGLRKEGEKSLTKYWAT